MKILETRLLRGPNIYRTGRCFAALLGLGGHRTVEVEELQGKAAIFRTLMPGSSAPALTNAAEVARLLVRLMVAAQDWAGSARLKTR